MMTFLKPAPCILCLFALFSFKTSNFNADPVLTILGKTFEDSTISLQELTQLEKIDMNAAFSEKGYVIDSYSLVFIEDNNLVEITGDSEVFSEEVRDAFSTLTLGSKFSIENIDVKAPTGMLIKLPAFSFLVED